MLGDWPQPKCLLPRNIYVCLIWIFIYGADQSQIYTNLHRTYSLVLYLFWLPAFSMSLPISLDDRFVYCFVSWGQILGRNCDKVLRVFLLAIHSQLNLRILHPSLLSKSGLKLVCKVNIECGNLKSEYCQDYAQKPQRNCLFMNSSTVADVPRPRKTTSPGLLTFVPQVHNYFQLDWLT